MYNIVFTLTVTVLFFGCTALTDDEHGTICPSFTAEDFTKQIWSKPHFIMFYAPWCGHCKKLAPTFDKLAESYLEKDNPEVVIAKVDCTVETALCSEHDVSGYPTVKLFRPDEEEALRYKGARDLTSLQEFLTMILTTGEQEEKTDEAEDAAGTLELTDKTIQAHVAKGKHFVKFYAPWCGHCKQLAPTWDELAEYYQKEGGVTIAKVDCTQYRSVCSDYSIQGFPTLLWIADGKVVDTYKKPRDFGTLTAYANAMKSAEAPPAGEQEKIPKVDEEEGPVKGLLILTKSKIEETIAEGKFFIMFYAPWCGHCKRLTPTWNQLAEKYDEDKDVTIAKIDCTANQPICTQFKVSGYPTLIWMVDGESVMRYSKGRDINSLSEFVQSMKNFDPTKAEEEAAAEAKPPQAEDGLYQLTEANFKEHVKEGNHFVKFYAPWCGHCTRLAPIWQELATQLKDDKTVSIAKVDCTEHATICAEFSVRSYPTLLWLENGVNEAGKYDGGRTLESLLAYARKMSGQGDNEEELEEKEASVPVEEVKEKTESKVVSLTLGEFDTVVGTGTTFVKFYAPWCGHCKTLAPIWDQLAEKLSHRTTIKIAKLDCTQNKELCAEHEVRGYPTLKLFRDGRMVEVYQGPRAADALLTFVEDSIPHDEL
ncbi:PREDICTED: thioredoxin domain-containing protein 5-like [Priapulus caudatus]|uniref:Thioredoxin domain-containing protein 5-like n=1 Tax=Priapulus caudatus TaxID=37621 RepID=A0ABM1EIK0_PRICU|nr:PREDICTED: thioredoxin domain-containing protein 5-like [Priapulus caudatus]